ncbi:P pilus assembly/Cpx signaling pathway, periplasmic inhibitor/zinc-resistance associated protein [Pyrinomonas methylaliphatogenes]|uniref:P pilus assembly/Cpx signaling pathway, periplasmic inhibitor/zinc-resistance associated protein n=2 Tax=Pyrinomonas methylaliphatogenes TaxID=454194 RepID=A0A0B6WZN7_9BACT|nr:P pilus assembly/Cpx signaling pathway, periplasmic inhibitor/zinc-resistance associated protein [Pyrinomonas methylaliphatogenes]
MMEGLKIELHPWKIEGVISRLGLLAMLLSAIGAPSLKAQVRNQARPAQPIPQAGAAKPKPVPPRPLLEILNLTPEQKQQIRSIRRKNDLTGRMLLTRLREAQRALDEAIYADNLDEREFEARVQELIDAQSAVTRHRARVELEIRRILTPEQLKLFKQLREQQRARANQPRP